MPAIPLNSNQVLPYFNYEYKTGFLVTKGVPTSKRISAFIKNAVSTQSYSEANFCTRSVEGEERLYKCELYAVLTGYPYKVKVRKIDNKGFIFERLEIQLIDKIDETEKAGADIGIRSISFPFGKTQYLSLLLLTSLFYARPDGDVYPIIDLRCYKDTLSTSVNGELLPRKYSDLIVAIENIINSISELFGVSHYDPSRKCIMAKTNNNTRVREYYLEDLILPQDIDKLNPQEQKNIKVARENTINFLLSWLLDVLHVYINENVRDRIKSINNNLLPSQSENILAEDTEADNTTTITYVDDLPFF